MQNSSQKERDFWATNVQEFLTDISPILIIGSFGASLIAFGVLKFNYHVELFSEKLPTIGYLIAGMVAVVSQLLRFAFGLAGVRDLVRGRTWIGVIGITASIMLSIYEHFEAKRMATHWGNEHLWYIFVFLVWVALVAEIRLIMTMSKHPNYLAKKGKGKRPSKNGQNQSNYDYELTN